MERNDTSALAGLPGTARSSTEQLIAGLASGLVAVRPLAPPVTRALLWLAGYAALVAALVAWRHALPRFLAHTADLTTAIECAATLATGITAVVAAFYLSVPDRSPLWRYAPLPPLALWLASSGLGCLQHGVGLGPAGERFGESPGCFVFIVGASLPLAAVLYSLLRRARPLSPLPVALVGALGVAALAAFVLQFFHGFDTTVIDLAFHLAALGTVLALAKVARRLLA
jgi:xanthosine utilization system XapX-like protein